MTALAEKQLATLIESEPVQRLFDAQRAELHERRMAAVAAIQAVTAKEESDFAIANKAYEAAEKHYRASFEKLQAATVARQQAYAARTGVCGAADRDRSAHERFLRESEDPRISELHAQISANYPIRLTAGTAPTAAITALNAERLSAIKELTELWREALDNDALTKRLSEIRKRVKLSK